MSDRGERSWDPDWVVYPGEVLAEMLKVRGLTSGQAAGVLGLTVEGLQELLDATLPVDEPLTARLAAVGGVPALWAALERMYRAGLARGLNHSHPQPSQL